MENINQIFDILSKISTLAGLISFFSPIIKSLWGYHKTNDSKVNISVSYGEVSSPFIFKFGKFFSQIIFLPIFFYFYNRHLAGIYGENEYTPDQKTYFALAIATFILSLFFIGYWGNYTYQDFRSNGFLSKVGFILYGLLSISIWILAFINVYVLFINNPNFPHYPD